MEEAKSAVQNHLSKSGRHDTSLHERVAPAVQNETISRKQHESQTAAVDREVHQDHYHTSEQPITHSETLPEQHHHRAIPVDKRSFEHDDSDKLKRGLDDERRKYQDTQTRVEGEKTRSENPVVAGEHVHHHVHETIQPVVNKQTVEPHVVHTTVPIHEVHHNKTHHHAASALPAMTMDEFKKGGGALGGREERHEHFDGEPRSFGGHGVRDACVPQDATADQPRTDDRARHAATEGIGNERRAEPTDRIGSDRRTEPSTATSNGASRYSQESSTRAQPSGHKFGTTEPDPAAHKKPSLLDRINPKKDADGDGKAGFMK